MKKCSLYHGTVTGKDDIFLDSFIVTGAVSGMTRDPVQQRGGFYVSVASLGWACLFSHTTEQEKAQQRDQDEHTLRYGRGMVVQLEMDLNAKDWNLDHEDIGDSLKVIEAFEGDIPSLVFNNSAPALENPPTEKPFFVRKKKKDELEIKYKGITGRSRTFSLFLGEKRECLSTLVNPTFFLDQIHHSLEKKSPEQYLKAKQKVIDEMAERGWGRLKYIGNAPLRVSKIYLRPIDSPIVDEQADPNDPLKRWEIAYDRSAPHQKPIRQPQAPRHCHPA